MAKVFSWTFITISRRTLQKLATKIRCSVTRFGEISPLWQKFRCFGKSLTVYFLFGKMLSQLWQTCYIIFQIFTVANGQVLKNNLTIWSHWSGDYSRPVPHLLFITYVWCVALLHIPNWIQRWDHFGEGLMRDIRHIIVKRIWLWGRNITQMSFSTSASGAQPVNMEDCNQNDLAQVWK